MKVLIFGANGMLGHKLYQVLERRFDVTGTIRKGFAEVATYGLFDAGRIIEAVDVSNITSVERVIAELRPNVVINAVGVIKQKPAVDNVETTLTVNSIFPHRLGAMAARYGFRLICISTDCVFSGDRGGYEETDVPDALDLYGQSKHWGEATGLDCLTLRTSIIGHELSSSESLISWLYSNEGNVIKGFRKAIFSGFPTITFARIISNIIECHKDLRGLYHISSDPIDKYSLLSLVREVANLDVTIQPDDEFVIDRSLNSEKFRAATGFQRPSWNEMIREMCLDPTAYPSSRGRGTRA